MRLPQLVVLWLTIFVSVFIAEALLGPRVQSDRWLDAAVFAAVLALLNTLVRPVLLLITCPIRLLTFGLFTLIINGFLFWLATVIYPGVRVADFLSAVLAALIVSLVGAVMNALLR